MKFSFYQLLERIEQRISNLEMGIKKLDEKFDLSLAIQRNHLIRLKRGEELSDDLLMLGRPYNDLTPDQALKIYNNKNFDFIFLDVSEKGYTPPLELEGLIKIPLNEIAQRVGEISSKTIPILIISENGLGSILACEFFIKKGYFNLNNVSGGYDFWKGKEKLKSLMNNDDDNFLDTL